ncbi:MAG: hypothetical protein HQ517_02995 [SAR324 cluster bacterium]|nr:hypothetical protein [SAR324 cluster bacterium]
MSEKKQTVEFEYKISPNYSVYAIAGAHGGLNAKGNIIVNFFSERTAMPKKQTYEVNTENGLDLVSEEKKAAIIRDVPVGISINAADARAIASWLNAKADEFDRITLANKPEELNG